MTEITTNTTTIIIQMMNNRKTILNEWVKKGREFIVEVELHERKRS